MPKIVSFLILGTMFLTGPVAAQLALPRVGVPDLRLPRLPVEEVVDRARETVQLTVEGLAAARLERIDRLVRRHRELIEIDARGEPARRGELLLVDADPAVVRAAEAAGFVHAGTERMDSLGLTLDHLSLPRGMRLPDGEALLRRVAPGAQIAPDSLHFQTGTAGPPVVAAAAATQSASITTPVGVIDGAPAQDVQAVRGFAKGAPVDSNHGSAVASLLASAGVRAIRVADVYGTDPAGGNALALVRAIDWLIGGGAKVISISLAGPNNSVVGKAIAAAQRKGAVIVSAVGNDGPAAPPAYPASYPGVVAVTAVDGRARPLIEAGRALHLDYAAPGADIVALNKAGKRARVRGTSYAVPLVAARAARAIEHTGAWRATLDREAEDLGRPGADDQFGRGLLCRTCARPR